MTKESNKSVPQANVTLAIVSIVLGILSVPLSFVGAGGFLGIPAIILGSIALAKRRPGTGLSITGIIAGTIGIILSLVAIAVLLWLLVAGYDFENPDNWHFEEPAKEQFESGSV